MKTVSIQDAIIPDKHIGVQMWNADHSVGEHQHNFLEMIYILEMMAVSLKKLEINTIMKKEKRKQMMGSVQSLNKCQFLFRV